MRVITALLASLVAVAANPASQRIVGGTATTINQYPSIVALLYSQNGNSFRQQCGGTVLNNRSILTAAHCPFGDHTSRWRVRAGSTFANRDGNIYVISNIIYNPNFNFRSMDSDIAILRTSANIPFSNVVQPGSIAGANYNLADNQVVWAAGWGRTKETGSEQLRHVQVYTINQSICRQRYERASRTITPNMLCSGVLDVGGRDQCDGDFGGPLYHNNVVVGVSSFGVSCAHKDYPGVNVRVSRFTRWIQNNA
ncbi:trypsin, alkaline C-like [Helicoverpa zea]|uniref:trypsin, alkaline C-like n=1 Tax=Helicoverpa zea TaxID=7113 RepID=UPI001F55B2DE|nr:trypsin, alkaline C-like [Helicoverpa zea]